MGNYTLISEKEIREKYSSDIAALSPFDIGIPLIDLSDKTIEEIYYYRWHTFCRHIRSTPEGYVITEFYPDVPWSGKYNTISCAAGHHLYEGRWLYDPKYLKSYAQFWCSPDALPRKYSFWAANAIYSFCEVMGDFALAEKLYAALKENYNNWEKEKGSIKGLYYQVDLQDGMEYSAGGSGLRPTINSYMYGEAVALGKIANRLGKTDDSNVFNLKAKELKNKINDLLWDEKSQFFKTMNVENQTLVDPKEQIGYVPWYFNIPDNDKSVAWKYLNDPDYFYAPFGPTTAEKGCAEFMKEYDHDCLWNGPSWPYATSQTLTALNNLLSNYEQDTMHKTDYYNLLHLYAASQYLDENGKRVPFIDENIDPFTGEWIVRNIWKSRDVNDTHPKERGAHYNHSTYCDLVINGLGGILPSDDKTLVVDPKFSCNDLSYFCLDGVKYQGHLVTVVWDKSGEKYSIGKGFFILLDGEKVFSADLPQRYAFDLGGKQNG